MIDARGMRCPWPAIRLARALRTASGDMLEIATDDPAAPAELDATARQAGWRIDNIQNGHVFRLVRETVNDPFTSRSYTSDKVFDDMHTSAAKG